MILRLETDAIRDKKDNRLLLHQKRRIDGKIPSKCSGRRGKSLCGTRDKIPCRYFFKGKCTSPSCNYWHTPVCLNCKSESGCICGETCRIRHVKADGQPSKTSKKGGVKDQLPCYKSLYNWVVCLPRLYGMKEKLGSNYTVKFSKWHVARHNNSGKKGSIARPHSKV